MVSIPLHSGGAPHAAMRDALGWGRVVVATVARGLVTALLGMALWAVAPAALGWSPTTVMTGSMEPRIAPGDVVVSRPVPTDELRPGRILLADDPDQPGHLRMHRYVEDGPDGTLVTKGDANPQQDSTPLARDAVHGVAFLRVPMLGLPVVWIREGAWDRVGALALGLVAVLALCAADGRLRRADDPSDGSGGDGDATVATTPDWRHGSAPPAPPVRRGAGPRPSPAAPGTAPGPSSLGEQPAAGLVAVTLLAVGVGSSLPAPAVAAPWFRSTAAVATLAAGSATAATDPVCVPNGDGTVSVRFGYAGPPVASFSVVNTANGTVIATGDAGQRRPRAGRRDERPGARQRAHRARPDELGRQLGRRQSDDRQDPDAARRDVAVLCMTVAVHRPPRGVRRCPRPPLP